MASNPTPAAGSDTTGTNTPSTPPGTGFTPINALTPSSAMTSLFLDAPSPSQHPESALRSTIAREAATAQDATMDHEDAIRSTPASPARSVDIQEAMTDDDDVTRSADASPARSSGVEDAAMIDEDVASDSAGSATAGSPPVIDQTTTADENVPSGTTAAEPAPATSEGSEGSGNAESGAPPASTPFQIPASFQHRVASLDDPPLPPVNAALIKSLGSAADAIAAADVPRSECFPHNFNYAEYTTVEQLEEYLDPASPLAVLHPDDVDQFPGTNDQQKAYNLVKALQTAALAGHKIAPNVDHSSGKGDDVKEANAKWHATWENFIGGLELPIEKGAGAVGYRVAKRKMMQDAGNLNGFFICVKACDTEAGCLTHQFRSDASRNAISNFFGRNKNATSLMAAMPLWCRKHYQNMAYDDEAWQKYKKGLICGVLDRNEAAVRKNGKQNLTYTIELRRCDKERVAQVALKKGDGAPEPNNKHPSTLAVLQHMHDQYVGTGKTMADAKALAEYVLTIYKSELAVWKAGKDEKAIKKQIKAHGPKYVEFQLIPEWEKVYSAAEIAAASASTAAPGTPRSSAIQKRSPGSKRKVKDESEAGSSSTPSKKQKTKK